MSYNNGVLASQSADEKRWDLPPTTDVHDERQARRVRLGETLSRISLYLIGVVGLVVAFNTWNEVGYHFIRLFSDQDRLLLAMPPDLTGIALMFSIAGCAFAGQRRTTLISMAAAILSFLIIPVR
jgi:hypothetical protein